MWISTKRSSRMCRLAFRAGFRMCLRMRPTSTCARASAFSPCIARTLSAVSRSICWPGRTRRRILAGYARHGRAGERMAAARPPKSACGNSAFRASDRGSGAERQGAAQHRCRLAGLRLHYRARRLAECLRAAGDKALHHRRSFHGVGVRQCVSERRGPPEARRSRRR